MSEHTHMDSKGVFHTCFHECKTLFSQWSFWIGVTISWPLEHWAWANLPVLRTISKWLGIEA